MLFSKEEVAPLVTVFALMFLSLFGLLFANYGTRRFRSVVNAVEKYDDYKAAFQQKWGEPPPES